MIDHNLENSKNEIKETVSEMQWSGSAQTNIKGQYDTCLNQLDNEINRMESFNKALELLDQMLKIDKNINNLKSSLKSVSQLKKINN